MNWAAATSHAFVRGTLIATCMLLAVVGLWRGPTFGQGGVGPEVPPGSWYEVPDTKLRAVLPSPLPDTGYNGPHAIVDTWNGAAYDTHLDALVIPGAGGHADYGGNEVYAFWLSRLRWERLTDPSPTTRDTTEALADGRPASRHTYDGVSYIESIRKIFVTGGSLWYSGNGSKGAWTFDVRSRQWERRKDAPSDQITAMTEYDPRSNLVYSLLQDGTLAAYNPTSDSWTVKGGTGGWAGFARTMILHPPSQQLLVVGHGEMFGFKISSWFNGRRIVQTRGGDPVVRAQAPGLAYHPQSERIVGWVGGGDVYTLDLVSGLWSHHAPVGSNTPGLGPKTGTYGRWQYVPSRDLFVAVTSIDENVWLYRLPALPLLKQRTRSNETPPRSASRMSARGQ